MSWNPSARGHHNTKDDAVQNQRVFGPSRSNTISSSDSHSSGNTESSMSSSGLIQGIDSCDARQAQQSGACASFVPYIAPCLSAPYSEWTPPAFSRERPLLQHGPEQQAQTSSYRQPMPPFGNHIIQEPGKETVQGSENICNEPNCTNRTPFTRFSDLKRHQKNHSHEGPEWHCGCCRNSGRENVYTTRRKDHMKQHLRKKHSATGDLTNRRLCLCNDGIHLVFVSRPCLLLHKRDYYVLTESEQSELDAALQAVSLALGNMNDCLRSHMPLAPSKRIKCSLDINFTDSRDDDQEITGAQPYTESDRLNQIQEITGSPPAALAGIGDCFESKEIDLVSISDLDLSQVPTLPALASTPDIQFPLEEDCKLTSLQIENVQAVYLLTVFEQIESALIAVTSSLAYGMAAEDAYISYNFGKQILNLHGPRVEVGKAREKASKALADLRKKCSLDDIHKQCVLGKRPVPGNATRTFSLRQKEDEGFISIWENSILPLLSRILRPLVGTDYSACFTRKGVEERTATPCIEIESPEIPSKSDKKEIKTEIEKLLHDKLWFTMPKLHFCKGRMAYLAAKDYLEDEEDEDEEDDDDFFEPEKHYWKEVGMSASIGLMGARSVSATSGGYIFVDGKRYLLLVDHFIQKSLSRMDGQSGDDLILTSPSLADVRQGRHHHEKIAGKYEAVSRTVFNVGKKDISLQDIRKFLKDRCLQKILEKHTGDDIHKFIQSRFHLEEVGKDKGDENFLLGEITHRCSDGGRSTTRLSVHPKPGVNGKNFIKMDWALGAVTAVGRVGENRHRYRQSSENPDQLDYTSKSPGSWCQYTCALEPGAKVQYVGRTSGLRQGEISATRMLVVKDKVETSEWYMIPQGEEKVDEDVCAGDSGAWVVKSTNKHLMAQLWGNARGMLLVSPIEEVFKDIREVTHAKEVSLLRSYKPCTGSNAVSYTDICEDEESRPGQRVRRFRRSKVTTLTPLRLLLKNLEETLPQPLIATSENTTQEQATTETSSLEASLQLPPISSPVPSLVSSSSSSLGRGTPSPSSLSGRCSPSTPVQRDMSGPFPRILDPSSPPLILSGDNPPQLSQEPENDQQLFHKPPREAPPVTTSMPTKKKKHSVQYLLRDTMPSETDVVRAVTGGALAAPRPLRPLSKSSTFPMLDACNMAAALPPAFATRAF